MKSYNLKLVVILIVVSALYQTLYSQEIKWFFDTKDASFGQSAAGDIDGDGRLEIVFGCYRNDSCVYALNSEDGSLLWKYNASGSAEGCNDVAPLIYDIDSDGIPEVIVPSSCNPKTFCFDGLTGNVKWVANTRGSDSPPTVADFDGDGKAEILHGEFGGYVICINAEDGSIKWEIAVDTDSWIQTAPTILDADGDGALDFTIGTWNAVNKSENKIYAFNGANQSLLWSYAVGDVMYHGSAVADLDDDGRPEIVVGAYNDTLYCLNAEDGSSLWKYSHGGSYYMGAPATIADINQDGLCEVIFSAWYVVGILGAQGNLIRQFNIPDYGQAFRGVALADINNDDYPDMVFGDDNGKVYALDGNNGDIILSVDLAEHYGNSSFALDNAPLIADFDSDGALEIFIVGGHAEYPDFTNNFGRAYMIEAGEGKGPDWLMFQNDVWRRSSLCESQANGANESRALQEPGFSIEPTPAADYIEISINGATQGPDSRNEIEIYNTLGELVLTESIAAGGAKPRIDVKILQAGVYFIKYGSVLEKFVVVR